MHSYAVERLVPANAEALAGAVAELVATLWGPAARVVLDDGLRRVDAVAAAPTDEAADVWLTWQLTPVGGGTRIRLVLDELDAGPEPLEELGTVLDMLQERAGVPS